MVDDVLITFTDQVGCYHKSRSLHHWIFLF